MKFKEPTTAEQWQYIVDLAEGALSLDGARRYGLVTGGPDVNVDRCEDLLRRGKSLGYTPTENAIERFMLAAAGLCDESRERVT